LARKSASRTQSSRKTTQPRRPRKTRQARNSSSDQLIDAALGLLSKKSWRQVTFREIAAAAGLTTSEAAAVFPNKDSISAAFFRRIDEAVDRSSPASDGSARDRLFDVLMRRFDALSPHKSAVRAIASGMMTAPLFGLRALPRFMASMAHMLEAAEIDTTGPDGLLRVKGLAIIYLRTIRIWFTDDTTDHGRTMAALDKGLGWAERGATICPFRHSGSRAPDARIFT
jgi:AcrR family transcriptional regulator